MPPPGSTPPPDDLEGHGAPLRSGSGSARLVAPTVAELARLDAEAVYRDLSDYRINVYLEREGWHVDYELKDVEAQGGGPRYVIDSTSGKILSKKYEQ